MNFQLLKLIIWPKNEVFPPRVVEFQTGKVNVITGSSRTGKSAIIPIIDYCLGSFSCNIPIDTIRNFSSWYGIIAQIDNEQILLCRRKPEGSKSSLDFYIERGKAITVPTFITEPNEKLDNIKHLLNSLSSVPYLALSEEEKLKYKQRLSFRDLVALVFQSQDIVANQNILFYKTHEHEHREKLRNWFPYILGAETMEILKARHRIEYVENRLNQLRKEFNKAKVVSDSWMANMVGHLRIAKEYGLIQEFYSQDQDPLELLEIAREVTKNIPDYSDTDVNSIQQANDNFLKLETEETAISLELASVKKRLNDLKSLKSGFIDYGNSVRKRVDRLHISKWLGAISLETSECPMCGSSEHPNMAHELNKIMTVFEQYETESKDLAEVPTSFDREEERLTGELERLIERKKSFQNRFDLVLANDKQAQREFQRRKNMFIFLGHFKASLETFSNLIYGGELESDIRALEGEFEELSKKTDSNGVKRRTEIALSKISQKMLLHLNLLDVENKYKVIPPKLDIENLNIQVLSDDQHWHFLGEVGSASNWVAFHISLMCALQEYFLDLENSCVPSFVIFDQPSQVYFPKVKRSSPNLESNLEAVIPDEDTDAVKAMFKTISMSIKNQNGKWQSIILDHADDSIYGDLEGIYQVEEWRKGKKLIPNEWIGLP